MLCERTHVEFKSDKFWKEIDIDVQSIWYRMTFVSKKYLDLKIPYVLLGKVENDTVVFSSQLEGAVLNIGMDAMH